MGDSIPLQIPAGNGVNHGFGAVVREDFATTNRDGEAARFLISQPGELGTFDRKVIPIVGIRVSATTMLFYLA